MEMFREQSGFVTRLSDQIRSRPAVARLDSSLQRDKKYDKSTCFSAFILGRAKLTATSRTSELRHLADKHNWSALKTGLVCFKLSWKSTGHIENEGVLDDKVIDV
jgi:hypothetical protein